MWSNIVEGETTLIVPENGSFGKTAKGTDKKAPVFYNPRMKLNRDVTCAVVKALQKDSDIRFLDLLAGSGAKGIRAANETSATVHLNDGNSNAVEAIKSNAKKNRLVTKVAVTNENANLLLQKHPFEFDFIDIDPFGTPVPFLENALMAVKNNGYLGITATDTAPLCGVYPMSCYRKYGAVPLRSEFCHEVGMRILLGHTARAAARYARSIKCVFSHSTEHYIRAFVQVQEGKEKAKKALKELGYVYYCKNCLSRTHEKSLLPENRTCSCGKEMETAGPLWLGKIKDDNFAGRVLVESAYLEDRKTAKLMTTIAGELHEPFYYDTHVICDHLNISAPSMDSIIQNLSGHSVSRTHFKPTAIKTDATLEEVKNALR